MDAKLTLAATATLDPDGVMQDAYFLENTGWVLTENLAHASWEKKGTPLELHAQVSQDNVHRLIWELSINSEQTRVGYFSQVLRPGDVDAHRISGMVQSALKSGEDALNKWRKSLDAAKKSLGV